MKRTLTTVGAITVLIGSVGCLRSTETMLTASPKSYAPVPMDSVAVFLSLEELDRFEWEGLALIKSEFLFEPTEDRDWVDDLRKNAGNIGANAILILGPGDFSARRRMASLFLGPSQYRPGDILAVRILGERP